MQARLLQRFGLRLVVALAASSLALSAQAQPEPVTYGKVDARDLTAAPFTADSAAAVVLADYGRSSLRGHGDGFQVVFERVTRIKILTKAGFDEASVEIPLYHRNENTERVTNLRGCTYNLVNGKVEKTPLATAGVFMDKRTPLVNVQKFTLPNVREGSVIEFAYTLTSDFLFNFQDWTFQRTIPVRWSEYRVSIPVFYKYKIIYQSTRPLDVHVSRMGSTNLRIDHRLDDNGLGAGQVTGSLDISAPTEEHQWVLKNLPALPDEPYMTTPQDYVARLDFELTGEQWPESPYRDLTGSWEKINSRLLNDEDFGGRIAHTSVLKEPAQSLAARYPDVAARAAAVRELVMAAVRYNGTDRYFAPEPLRKAYDAHLGTSADVNLLLLAALRDAGITAYPLLLSTRSHGHISQEFPLLERFNYVAAVVPLADGHDLLLDATAPLVPCGALPVRCLNRQGRVVGTTPATSRWVDLTPALRRGHYQQVNLVLDARGGLSGKVHAEHAGYAAAEERAELSTLGEKKYLAAVAARHEGWAVSHVALGQANQPNRPLTLDYEFSQPGEGPATGPIYLSPLRFFGPGRNPFQHETRAFAIDFGMAQDETLVVNLTLPEGYELAELPKSQMVDLPDNGGRFVCSVSAAAPGSLQFTSRLSLRNPVYGAEQYPNLRELYRRLLEKQAERLVIQKKAGS